jgi:hypothetical protein
MPFKSKAQMRKFFAMVGKGQMDKREALKWARETPAPAALPEKKGAPDKDKAKAADKDKPGEAKTGAGDKP